MSGYSGRIEYGGQVIAYRVGYADRKTMEIAVHPGGRVVVKAPKGTAPSAVKERIRKRARWIGKQINYFRQFEPETPPRRYVGGETHLYLGKPYRLKLKKSEKADIKLKGDRLVVSMPEPHKKEKVKSFLEEWYDRHARAVLFRRFVHCFKLTRKLNLQLPAVRLRKMAKRWGCCDKTGCITLNIALVKTPLSCIDYVIVHELCHLKEHAHNSDYFKLLTKYMPDWEKRKERLEKVLI